MSGADTVLNYAKFAWEIIKEGKPTAEITSATANAVPDVPDWTSLSDTRGPNSHRLYYSIAYVWPFDDYVHAEFEILLKWQFGAKYKNGGAFIPNMWIEVPSCFVGFGWDVNIGVSVRNPTNVGTAGAPIAALPVTIKGTVSSGLENYHVEWGFTLYGSGGLDHL
jgi:hypothetical protein